jgi:diaminopimelate decarboxylase
MHYFKYKGKKQYCEEVPVARIVKEVGTPVYIYSTRTLKRHFDAFGAAFKGVESLICYSVKANSNLSVLRTFAAEGSGFDIVSGGELYRALKAGAKASKIVFSGVGKTAEEMEFALRKKILIFNVESPGELRALDRAARRLKSKARFSIRVNPDVDAKTHPYVSTGLKKNKFGIPAAEAVREYVYAKGNLKYLEAVGIDCHIGSQLTEIGPFVDALTKTARLVKRLRKLGLDIRYLDIGGGLGITYDKESPPHPSRYGSAVIELTKDLGVTLIFEPGRVLVGNAGILVTKVLYTKRTGTKNFIIVDAAMNDLYRPSLYGSYHAIKAVQQNSRKEITADVVGPICETGDFLARNRLMRRAEPGDLLAVMSAGAYGFTMSSNYNSRPRAAEVMVDGRSFSVIRKREGLKDLIRGE